MRYAPIPSTNTLSLLILTISDGGVRNTSCIVTKIPVGNLISSMSSDSRISVCRFSMGFEEVARVPSSSHTCLPEQLFYAAWMK